MPTSADESLFRIPPPTPVPSVEPSLPLVELRPVQQNSSAQPAKLSAPLETRSRSSQSASRATSNRGDQLPEVVVSDASNATAESAALLSDPDERPSTPESHAAARDTVSMSRRRGLEPLNTGPDPGSSSSSTGGRGHASDSDSHDSTTAGNGHARGRTMNSSVDLRRKHASLESPTSPAHLMAHEGFSLDTEPPTPLTPIPHASNTSFFALPPRDQRNFILLVLLYFLQGVPMGLAGGSVPFLLKEKLSYSQIGIFSLASYPYSLKLLWSPIVDAVWSQRVGRRKSWIIPIQFCSAFGMLYMGSRAEQMMKDAAAPDGSGIWTFTVWWFLLVFLCATQDIAVDGWALTLLSQPNLSYASTAQTVGLTAGQFLSYTVFLALYAPEFANRWFRSEPQKVGILTLGGYLSFWGWAYLLVTVALAVLKREDRTRDRDGIIEVYRSMLGILKIRNIQTIIIIHLIAKIGFQANDAVTNLKLLDKGFSKEDMALTVLIDFPFEISLGYYAGRWSTQFPTMDVWCWAFIGRLVAALVAQGTVMIFPAQGTTTAYLLAVIGSHIFSTFTSTVMFVAVSAFHARIADPVIGGTYMTLLATVSNLGGTFPRFFILKLVDMFTQATCQPPTGSNPKIKEGASLITTAFNCALEADKQRCLDGGGKCLIQRDGYYLTNIICVIIGAVTFWGYIKPAAKRLQQLPLRAWRLAPGP